MPRTVLYFSDLAILGGGEVAMAALLETLDRERFRPLVMAPAEGPLTERMRALGIDCRVVKLHEAMRFWKLRKHWPPRRRALRRGLALLARVLDEERVDLIHTHGGMYPENFAHLGRAARPLGIPIVWDCAYSGAYRQGIVRQFMMPWVDHVVACSDAVSDMLRQEGWPASVPIDVFHYGLDLAAWKPGPGTRSAVRRELGAADGETLFGMVGRVVPFKGHDVFFEAVRRLIDRGTPARFVVVGDQRPDEGSGGRYYRMLSEAAAAAPLSSRLVMAGWREDVPDVMNALDVLVQPSREEAFGRTLIEAMAFEKPVIASRVGGMREVVVDGVTGCLLPAGDAAALAEAMATLAADTALRARMGRAARERVLRHFNLERRTRAIETVYDRLRPERVARRTA